MPKITQMFNEKTQRKDGSKMSGKGGPKAAKMYSAPKQDKPKGGKK